MKAKTKRISDSIYLHLETKKYISRKNGEISITWNVWHDETLCDEIYCGFTTKSEAITYLDSIYNN